LKKNYSQIYFFSENIPFQLKGKQKIKKWISDVVLQQKHVVGNITFVFCSDDYLLKINQHYLNHDTFTDIISFDYSELIDANKKLISGEIYISIQRVKENAKLNKEHESVTRTYLELVFQTAVRMDFDSLVLPAFGCEGHHHPPRHVATIIKELTQKYSGYLKEVVICMPEINDHVLGNYHIFREVFGLDKEIIESTPLEVSTISKENNEEDNKEVVLDEILEKVEEEKI